MCLGLPIASTFVNPFAVGVVFLLLNLFSVFCRDSAKGEKFSVWRLSDLSGQSAVVSLFLFGKAFQEHWKTPQGYVIALLNANVMENREVRGAIFTVY